MNDLRQYYIYCITNTINLKTYVGQTCRTIKTRWQEHNHLKSGCKKLQRAISKYGKNNFTIEILTTIKDLNSANFMESFFIKLFDSINNGYNIRPGGMNSCHSEHTKALMSLNRLGCKNGMYGKNHNEKSKKKISESRKGQIPYNKGIPNSLESKNKVSMANKGRLLGENNPQAKLTRDEVSEIKHLIDHSTYYLREIAEKYNVSLSAIKRIRSGKAWK